MTNLLKAISCPNATLATEKMKTFKTSLPLVLQKSKEKPSKTNAIFFLIYNFLPHFLNFFPQV